MNPALPHSIGKWSLLWTFFLSPSSLLCFFSIPGASGQPDEPPGSMSHQASVQQFSGQYFSPANPSDAEALYEFSSGKNTLNEKPSDEHALHKHA